MQCPACGADNPENAWQCSCGNYFANRPEPPAVVAPAAPTVCHLSFHGRGGPLLGIYVINILLSLVTLGVYYFWGKVKIRQYLYGQTEFEGDRFAFHGTGKELLVGTLKAILVFGVVINIPEIASLVSQNPVVSLVATLLYMAGMLVLVPVALVGSRRYRLSRTSWREIRFSFRGHSKDLIRIFVPGAIFTGLSLGIYYPFFMNRLREFLVGHCYFGNRSFGYDGKGSEIFRIYAFGMLLSVLTLGLYYFWFDAQRERYYWAHTSFASARFRATVTGLDYLLLGVGYVFLLLVTLGLAWPWVQAHYARFRADHLQLEGPLDLVTIQQEALAASATGEGLAEFVDVGLLDMDLGI